MYGVEWLIVLGLLGLALGLGAGFLLGGTGGFGTRKKVLQEQLAQSQRELTEYRQEVVTQFSETARRFQALDDAYTDLHEQLAHSSSVLCGDVNGPLLAAPSGHQDLIPGELRGRDGDSAKADAPADAQPADAKVPVAAAAAAGLAAAAATVDDITPSDTSSETWSDPEAAVEADGAADSPLEPVAGAAAVEDDEAINVSEPPEPPLAARPPDAEDGAESGNTADETDDGRAEDTGAEIRAGGEDTATQVAANEPETADADGANGKPETDDEDGPLKLAEAEAPRKVANLA